MRPLFADGIDIPIFLTAGFVVLLPLMLFEIFVEALVLKRMWQLPYRELCGLTFRANCWSLLAGIPTKILNAFIYYSVLSENIPVFLARYPYAVGFGTFLYFAVTVLVESGYAFGWVKRNQLTLSRQQIWRGMLWANVATYAVLAPLHYYATSPHTDIRQFTKDTRWTHHPGTTILFVSQSNGYLNSIQADGSGLKTIVPFPMTEYLVSSNLNLCLFRSTNGDLYYYRRDTGKTNPVWQPSERFYMNQVAFSPSGDYVAFISAQERAVQFMNVVSGERVSYPLSNSIYAEVSVAWSPDERKFFFSEDDKNRFTLAINTNGTATVTSLEGTNAPPLLRCFETPGRMSLSSGEHYSGRDACGDLTVQTFPYLVSWLVINQKSGERVMKLNLTMGLLHLSGFRFGDAEFLDDCNECLFEAYPYLYILDIKEKRVGTLVKGRDFIQLTSKNAKTLR